MEIINDNKGSNLKPILIFYSLAVILITCGLSWASTLSYQYDDLHRLTRVERSDGTIIAYQYDELGNRTRKVVTSTTSSPKAMFSATPVNGSPPLNVTFKDESIGNITSWQWDFGDTQTSNLQNPSHTYGPGTYSVTLTVSGPNGGDSYTRNNYITTNAVPTVIPGTVTVNPTSAFLQGLVNPNGSNVHVWFEWGTTTNYGNTTTVRNFGNGTTPLSTAENIFGLIPETTYHFRLVAQNDAGLVFGPDQTFTTSGAQNNLIITTGTATVTPNSAIVYGNVLNNCQPLKYVNVNAYFVWGPTTAYGSRGNSFPYTLYMGSADVSDTIIGLLPNTTYHYRLVAESDCSNPIVVNTGEDRTFLTTFNPGQTPTVFIQPALVNQTSAILQGFYNPNGLNTDVWFEWGTTVNYGNTTPIRNFGNGIVSIPVAETVNGLIPGTTYHFRLVAQNIAGKSVSQDQTFYIPYNPTLNVTVIGQGQVTSTPMGISCGNGSSDCSETYFQSNWVTLKAIRPVGIRFDGWGGSCSGTGDCLVYLDPGALNGGNRLVTAKFSDASKNWGTDLSRTGQETVFGPNDDGTLQTGINWPNPRFTHQDGHFSFNDGKIKDQLTGLLWMRDGSTPTVNGTIDGVIPFTCNGGVFNWTEALNYANCWNQYTGLYGRKDWRLPNVVELESLMNSGDPNAAAWLNSQGFENIPTTSPTFYWTSTTYSDSTDSAWVLSATEGRTATSLKTNNYLTLLVAGEATGPAKLWKTGQTTSYNGNSFDDGILRKGAAWPSTRLYDNQDGTVTDILTGLVWLKDANCLKTKYPGQDDNDDDTNDGKVTWDQALGFVSGINSGLYAECGAGKQDWRMPNRKELFSLTDFARNMPALLQDNPFQNVASIDIWSSTTDANEVNNAWVYNTYKGQLSQGAKTGTAAVWPVRTADVDPRPTVQFGAAEYTAAEDGGSVTIELTLSNPLEQPITMQYDTLGGSAQKGKDYWGGTGSVTFQPNEVRKAFEITLFNDGINEGNKTVNLVIPSEASGNVGLGYVLLGNPQTAILTIVDNDPLSAVRFTNSQYQASEDAGLVNIEVELSAPTDRWFQLPYSVSGGSATAGQHFIPANGFLNFQPGDIRKSFAVAVLEDSVTQGNRTVNLALSNDASGNVILGNPNIATLTINYNGVDDQGPALAVTSHYNGQTVNTASIILFGTATDAGRGDNGVNQVLINGSPMPNGSVTGNGVVNWTTSLTLNQGANTITVSSSDGSSPPNQMIVSLNILYNPAPIPIPSTFISQYGDSNTNVGLAIHPSNDGGQVFIGTCYGCLNPEDQYKPFIVKIDQFGQIEWQKKIEGLSISGSKFLFEKTDDQGYVLMGAATTGFKIIKIADNGSVLWGKSYVIENGFRQGVNSIKRTMDGGFIVSGRNIPWGPNFLMRIDRTGELQWVNTIAWSSGEWDLDFVANQTQDGGYILTGSSAYDLNDGLVLIKLNSNRIIQWQKWLSGSSFSKLATSIVAKDGNIIASLNSTYPVSAGCKLLKLDQSGNILLEKVYQGPSSFTCPDIVEMPEEGSFSVLGTNGYYNSINILKIDTLGNIINQNQYLIQATMNSIQTSSENGLVAIGSKRGVANSQDIIVMKVGQDGSILSPCMERSSQSIVNVQDVSTTVQAVSFSLVSVGVTVSAINGVIADKNLVGQSCSMASNIVFFDSPQSGVQEDSGTATALVNLIRGNSLPVTINYRTCNFDDYMLGLDSNCLGSAIPGKDFIKTSGQIVFAPGETSKSIQVPIISNVMNEADRDFVISLSADSSGNAIVGNPSRTIITIRDDDPIPKIQFASNAYAVNKDETLAIIEVKLDNPSGKWFGVPFETTNGTALSGRDYLPGDGQLYFQPGDISKTFTVAILNPPDQYTTRSLTLALEASGNAYLLGNPSTATLTINGGAPQATVQFSGASYSVLENGGQVAVAVNLNAPAAQEVTVNYETGGGSAVAGRDYQASSGTIKFIPGESSKDFLVNIIDNSQFNENDRQFSVALKVDSGSNAVLGTPSTAAVTIMEDDKDLIKPVSSITSPAPGSLVMGNKLTIRGSADDHGGSGVNKVEVSLDGGTTWNPATSAESWAYEWPIVGDGSVTILSLTADKAGNVEEPGPGVTVKLARRQPTPVAADGRRLLVNGSPFTVKGVGYSPVPIGEDPEAGPPFGDYYTSNYGGIYTRDLPWLRQMGANVVRIWNWGNTADHLDFLDQAYNAGDRPIYVIPGFTINQGLNIDPGSPGNVRESLKTEFRTMVAAHKNHSAILMWAIGNNLNHFYSGNQGQLFSLINEMALAAHEEEGAGYHPVVVSLADESMPGTIGANDALVPGLDVWGVNAYRGKSFGSLFTDYTGVSTKPLLITEYGIDVYDQARGNEYEALGIPYQAEYAQSLWNQINANGNVCIGGVLREYTDEWWLGKYSSDTGCPDLASSIHSRCGFANGNQPDGYTNEEWWGIMRTVDNGTGPDLLEPRATFYTLKSLWTGSPTFKVTGGAYNYPQTTTYKASFSLDVTASAAPAGWLKYYYARTRMNFVSTGITQAYLSGSTATIMGNGTVNGAGGYTFAATMVNGNPDTFAIEIRKPDGNPYYSAPAKAISGGDLVIQMQ